jgi:hypothetical protein
MDDERLITLLREREVRDSGVKDFFDLADRLLERANVQLALSHLDRHSLLALSTERADAALLDDLALAVDGEAYDAVREVLAGWPTDVLARPEPAALAPVSQVSAALTDHAAGERAFSATLGVLEVIEQLRSAPARELARGGMALPDSKRLAGAANIPLERLSTLVTVAASAGLIELDGGLWQVTEAASGWQLLSTIDRWIALATAWIDTLPADLRALLVERRHSVWGEHLDDWVHWLYPASGDWMSARIDAQQARAELLGVTANAAPSTAGSHLLVGETDAAATAMGEHFPREVEGAYLQHDLSIVAPGPLTAPLDSRLREIAEVESRGLATTYRVSGESLARAFSRGVTEQAVRTLLETISLSGVPQPLDYLLDETARRHALVRVGTDDQGSYVRSPDADLLTSIRVDQRLASLVLRADGELLRSRLDARLLFWALSDARYPVAVENAAGEIVTLEREHHSAAAPAARDHVRELVERLRATAGDEHGEGTAWLERQLDLAIKSRIAVIVVVTMPNGTTADYLLEPTGLGGGRLRARDRKADIERTLPLTSISEVRAAD